MPGSALPSLAAFLLTLAAGLLLVRKATAWGFIDHPEERKVHSFPTPRTGGIAMVIGGALALGLAWKSRWVPWPDLPWQTWLAGSGFISVGALDDRFSFWPRQKAWILLALAALAAWPWVLHLTATGLPGYLPACAAGSPAFRLLMVPAAALLTFWFMAVPNAVNIEDAINGYMGGFTFIVLLALAFKGVDTRLALGALGGFLVLNWPKARHFMGDAGSFGCGFLVAECILRAGGMAHPWMSLALTAPISLDVAVGLVRRKKLGMEYFAADRGTCPHRLLELMGGSALLATPILWLNAAAFAWFCRWPLLALGQAIFYVAALVFLNRQQLFGKQRSESR